MPEPEMQKRQTQEYPAEKARQGEIILRGPGLRLVFIAGLVGAVVLAVVLGWLAR